MAVIPAAGDLRAEDLAVPLPLYAQVIGFSECAFFGVVNPADVPSPANRPLWKKSERDFVAHFLEEAQAEIEQVCNYPLKARWIEAERHDYEDPILLDWRRVIEAGIRATTTISAGEAVSHAADPAVVGPIATTVTDEDEVVVYHPGTTIEINPSDITISGGNLTIEIPRCRMLTEAAYADDSGVDYADTGIGGSFELTVDVVRVYNDNSTEGTLVWPHGTSSCASCSGDTDTACVTVLRGLIGEVDFRPASYSGGSWSAKSWNCYCHYPSYVDVYYRAGLTTLTAQARDAIIRLAHAKMPHDPCNIDPPNWLWTRDKEVPRALTRERLNCPFGLSNGAWVAYNFARSMEVVRGSIL